MTIKRVCAFVVGATLPAGIGAANAGSAVAAAASAIANVSGTRLYYENRVLLECLRQR